MCHPSGSKDWGGHGLVLWPRLPSPLCGPWGPPATHSPAWRTRAGPPAVGAPGAGLVELTRLSSAPSVPSTLRSPSSPIHEEDDSEALPAPGGAGLALSSSPEVRPLPCPSVPSACLLASQPPLLGAEGRGAPRVRGLAVSTRV